MPARLGAIEVLRLLDSHDIVPSKSLGQNFVIDPNTVERIARLARVSEADRVVEIGPGLGSLSRALLQTGADLTLVEIDERLVSILVETLPAVVRIVHADALHCDWDEVLEHDPRDVVLVANLPYNIATPLVLNLLEREPRFSRMIVMVQREVGERLAASPGGRDYGQPSVRVAYFAKARVVGRVSPEVFYPRPRVESVLVELSRHRVPAVEESVSSYADMLLLIKAGFGTRRKMLRKSLSGLVGEAAFEAAGVAPTARAEELSIADWGKLAACRRSIENSHLPN